MNENNKKGTYERAFLLILANFGSHYGFIKLACANSDVPRNIQRQFTFFVVLLCQR